MEKISDEYVLYEPTKSVSYGHQAREKDARKAWAQIEFFLRKWTILTSLRDSVRFQCVPPYEGSVKGYNEYRAYANRILGTQGEGLWELSPDDLPKALALAFDEENWPRQRGGGPANLQFSYEFEWANPVPPASSPLRRTSSLGITVSGKRIFIQPTFIFPWSAESGVVQRLVSDIESDIPVLLKNVYFKRMIPTKTGGYCVRRLTNEWKITVPVVP